MSLRTIRDLVCAALLVGTSLIADTPENQTPDISPIHSGNHLPFKISIKQAGFSLPQGFHSGVMGSHEGKWLFFAGRTNGLHAFADNNYNFPSDKQNTTVFVIDFQKKEIYRRSLEDTNSGLTQAQIDFLSVTSPQAYQEGNTLYMTGGYGVDSNTGLFDTKTALTAVNVPGLIHWVIDPQHGETAAQYIRQIFDPIFQVTGGYMTRFEDHSTLLVFGQNFLGYYVPGANGDYTKVVRRFNILDDGVNLSVQIKSSNPAAPNPNFRRRDLNVVPAIELKHNKREPYLIALSGVFTESDGAWTVPVTITPKGHCHMDNPTHKNTFKQGMNNYVSANVGLFSKKKKEMYTILLGGITYAYFEEGQLKTDIELPFINQVTTIKRDRKGHFKQYLMSAEYPEILSVYSNPGSKLLFGAGAEFIPAEKNSMFDNGVVELDKVLHDDYTLLGYIVGGIQSTKMNTHARTDTAASPYIFTVKIKHHK